MRQCAIYDALHGNLIRTVSAKGGPAPPSIPVRFKVDYFEGVEVETEAG